MTMAWTHLRQNWDHTVAAAMHLFPGMSSEKVAELYDDEDAFAAHLAESHDLTKDEARELIHMRLAPTVPDDMQVAAQ